MLDVPFSFLFSKEFVFGTLTEWLRFYNKWLYCGLWIVNGLLQSTGWPCVVAVMGNWFGKAGYAASFSDWITESGQTLLTRGCRASSSSLFWREKVHESDGL